MHLPINSTLQAGKYKIVRFISAGGFGCTYEAIHTGFDERVAIKEFFVKDFCNRDEETAHVTIGTTSKVALVKKLQKKFVDEARAIWKLRHNNIVQVSDVFQENGTAYYVMGYIDGLSLNDLVKKNGPLSETVAVSFIKQVAEALRYVHSQNRLHLDIKPGNIMVDRNGKAVLIDFGASKQYDEEAGENTSTLLGKTPGYAPLEQMGNDIVKFYASTDIYALGATFYKILTGITPPSATLLASGESLESLPAYISENVRNAIDKAMQINKNKRPQSIDEFLKILNTPVETDNTVYDGGEKVGGDDETEVVNKKEKKSKVKQVFQNISLCVAALVLGGGIGIAIYNDSSSTQSVPAENAVFYDAGSESIVFGSNTYKMVYVSGGTFNMGATSAQGNDAYSDEKPVHQVTLSSYYIGKYEVTQDLWQAVMGSNPSYFKGSRRPVEQVSWEDCQTFINKLNKLTGKRFRLPTEAEWEFAARGGNNSRGYKYSGSNSLSDVAWYYDNSGSSTHDVGTKSPNELDIYDMSGNVWEWCQDWYGNYSSSSQTNPTGAYSGSGRVYRGGGWDYNARNCRSSIRGSNTPAYSYIIGLRLVLIP